MIDDKDDKFVVCVMNTIKAVDEYGRREGNVDLIEEYYKLHGSYKGFVEYLKDIYEENNN